jgi:YVTN family beta-propeller protein
MWGSGDGSRVYVGLENGDALAAIDTASNTVVAEIPIGQAPQAVIYVPDAVPTGDGTSGLQPLGVAGAAAHLALAAVADGINRAGGEPTSVSLFDQGLTQVLQASVTGLEPGRPCVLALAGEADGGGELEPLAAFVTNPAGAAIVNAVGPIRQIVTGGTEARRRYLVIAPGTAGGLGLPVQVQAP